MNGESYKGGQFLPTTTLPKKSPRTRYVGTGRVEIEPYLWVESRPGFRPILRQFPYHPDRHPEMRDRVNPEYVDIGRLDALYAMWAAGERWISDEC